MHKKALSSAQATPWLPSSRAHIRDVSPTTLSVAFVLSGIAALTYQVLWQRALFVAFGVDIESVTIVVSTFMFGLGVGAWFGGVIADRLDERIPWAFCAMEAAIGLYGLASIPLIQAVGDATSGWARPAVAASSFGLLLLPTVLMGATLPMLVAYSYRTTRHVGISTGTLYALNTLGAALGAVATGFVGMYWLDIQELTWLAAGVNFLACAAVGVGIAGRPCAR